MLDSLDFRKRIGLFQLVLTHPGLESCTVFLFCIAYASYWGIIFIDDFIDAPDLRLMHDFAFIF